MRGPQRIPVFAELAESRAKQPRVPCQRGAKFERGDDTDRKVDQREAADRENPAVLPEHRHQKNRQKREAKSETENQQDSKDKRVLDPLAFFFEFRDEEIEAGMETRDKSGEDSFERLKKS